MQNITSRIELFFLDYVIFLMSESLLIRSLVAHTGKFFHQYEEGIRVSAVLLICAMVGLVAGRLLIRTGLAAQLH